MSLKQLVLVEPKTWDQPIVCRLVGSHQRVTETRSGWYVDLEDHSGRVRLELLDSVNPPTNLCANTLVQVSFTPIFDDRPIGLMVSTLMPASDRTASQVVSSMPRPVSSGACQAIEALQTIADGLGQDPLGGFLARVLQDPNIAPALLIVPASWNHHHAYPGGLLVHTVEVMRIVGELARLKLPHQPRRVWQCQMAAFIHDLGKVLTHNKWKPRRAPTLCHEFLSVRLVSPHLDWLASLDPESADELSASLQHGTRAVGTRPRGQSVVAELVALADQCSAMHLGELNRRELYGRPAANDSGSRTREVGRS